MPDPLNASRTSIEKSENDHFHSPVNSIFRVGDEAHESRPAIQGHARNAIFCQLSELKSGRKRGIAILGSEPEWRETARWVKFEESVEEGGNRWSKPFVASLPLHALMELRSCLNSGQVQLDVDASNLLEIWQIVLDEWVKDGSIPEHLRDAVLAILLIRHRHQHQRRLKTSNSRDQLGYKRSPSANLLDYDFGLSRLNPVNGTRSPSVATGLSQDGASTPVGPGSPLAETPSFDTPGTSFTPSSDTPGSPFTLTPATHLIGKHHKPNLHFFTKLPAGVEAANIMIAELDFLQKPISAFIRLSKPTLFANITEVPAASRFMFVLLGPKITPQRYHQIGRTMGTLMSDEVFQDAAYGAKDRADIMHAVDDFLGAATVLPPGEWDPSIRIEPPAKVQSHEARMKAKLQREGSINDMIEMENGVKIDTSADGHQTGIARTNRFCGGLIDDVKRKIPFYVSDFRDALHMQSLASFIFLYFASMTPLITFGGLMSDLLKKRMGALETILGRSLSGIVWGLTAGQPLVILGSTGPILIFELIIFQICEKMGLEYLSLRVWIGLWSMVQLLLMVAFDLSYLVSYITRFTEESFAALVSAIFVIEAFKKLFHVLDDDPLRTHPDLPIPPPNCSCRLPDSKTISFNENFTKMDCLFYESRTANLSGSDIYNLTNVSYIKDFGHANFSAKLVGPDCDIRAYVPDAFLLSVILFFGTYCVARMLKDFKNSPYFTTRVRQFVSDFAVIISISIFVTLDVVLGIHTPKLSVPENLEPTYAWRNGSWIVPFFGTNPWWTAILAFVPGLLATILIFMDQQITAVIINRKENRFRKGLGYHLDLLIVAILTGVLSLLGMPWMVADTVLSLTHVNSLKMESAEAAPGVQPTFLGVREQRVTNISIAIVIGASIFMTGVLQYIPMPVLFGVFLFMGLNALNGLQFTDRMKLIFMPIKYQPDYIYLRHVRINRVHLFTAVQLLCLAVLWVLKSFVETSVLFPVMVGALVVVRKLLDRLFTQYELGYLDDIIPENVKRKTEDKQNKKKGPKKDDTTSVEEDTSGATEDGFLRVRLPTGNYLSVPIVSEEARVTAQPLNFTDEVNKTNLWKKVSSADLLAPTGKAADDRSRKNSHTGSHRWRPSDVQEDEEKSALSRSTADRVERTFPDLTQDAKTPPPAYNHL